MQWSRLLRHLATSHRAVQRAFSPSDLTEIELAISSSERRHGGQIVFAAEATLTPQEIWHGINAHSKAQEVFLQSGCWNTEHNNGVLIYLLLADHDFVIVADRGIQRFVGDAGWEQICQQMEQAFRTGQFLQGVLQGIEAVAVLLAQHFPPTGDNNEVPNKPIVLSGDEHEL